MTTYTIDATDQTTETLLIAYQAQRKAVQQTAGNMYQQIVNAESAYTEFEAQLEVGGEFAPLAAYHTAKQSPVADAVVALRAKMAEVMGLMEQMEAAMPDGIVLFPGVPRAGA